MTFMSLALNTRLISALVLSLLCIQCGGSGATNVNNKPLAPVIPTHSYQIVNIYPHDPNAFTQGLLFANGKLLESTGEVGRSSLRHVELETGKVLKKEDVPVPFFAEGLTVLNGKIYQLTWQHQQGFIYDAETFKQLGTFKYFGEGWGLTTDGQSLIMSDGTNRLRFLDPDSFQVKKTISVIDGETPVNELNELEFVNGEIYANVWHSEQIAVINPQNGHVTAWIDLSTLQPSDEPLDEEAVLNGIAFDQANDRLFVTGKLWPRLFEVKVKKR